MKKILLVGFIASLFLPHIVMAAWWNPFSWFNSEPVIELKDTKTEILENRIKELEEKINIPTQTIIATSSTIFVATTTAATSTYIIKRIPKKATPVVNDSLSKQKQFDKDVQETLDAKYERDALVAKQKEKIDNSNIVMCNGQAINDTCASIGKKFFCGPDIMGCYTTEAISKFSICNGVTYNTTCPQDASFSCPVTGKGYCKSTESPEITALKDYMIKADEKERARLQAETDRQNSTECISAKSSLASIEAEIKPLQDKSSENYNKYLETGVFQDSSQIDSKIATLSVRRSGLRDKKYAACDNFYALPPKTYNTNCYTLNGTTQCTTQ